MSWVHLGTMPDSTNSLGGVILPVGVQWEDEHTWMGYAQGSTLSISGERDYQVQRLVRGRPITLYLRKPHSWLYRAKLDALKAFLSNPDSPMTLNWKGTMVSVIYRQHDAPALEFTEVTQVQNRRILDSGVFEGRIKLITV